MTITLIILTITILLFVWDKYSADAIALVSMLGLFLFGILDLPETLSGFSNPTIIMIVAFRCRIQGKLKFSNNFYSKMSNEIFYELNSNSFNENRWYNRLCFALNETVSIETGYLKQHINQLNLNRLQLGLFLSTKAKP